MWKEGRDCRVGELGLRADSALPSDDGVNAAAAAAAAAAVNPQLQPPTSHVTRYTSSTDCARVPVAVPLGF